MISVTKIFEFAAAHCLPNHEGLCQNLHGHGFRLEIEVTGQVKTEGPETGMIIDFSDLKEIVNDLIISRLDHSYLNDKFANPTAETMVERIADLLQSEWILSCSLVRVRLWETPTSYAEWRAE